MGERPIVPYAPPAPIVRKPEDAAALPRIDDTCRWAFEQAAHLRAGRFDQVDVANVADEIESVGKSEFRSFASGLEVILLHMLKWEHQRSKRSRSRVFSILEHRRRVRDDLDDNPSLKAREAEAIGRAYGTARLRASRQTRLRLGTFPEECPYGWERIMEAPHALDEG